MNKYKTARQELPFLPGCFIYKNKKCPLSISKADQKETLERVNSKRKTIYSVVNRIEKLYIVIFDSSIIKRRGQTIILIYLNILSINLN